MAKVAPDASASKVVGLTLAGSAAITCIGILVIIMLILSILPVYIPNMSEPGYGDLFTIPGLIIQANFTNTGSNFTGGSVINRGVLADICTQIFRAQNIKNFYACVVTRLSAYGPSNSTDLLLWRKRRALSDAVVYQVADISLVFTDTCGNRRALFRWFAGLTRNQNSTCVAQRAAICRSFITTPNPTHSSNIWSPFPNGYTQLVATNLTSCTTIAISSMSNIPYSTYAGVVYRFNATANATTAGDCYYNAIQPQWNLTSFIANNYGSSNSTLCSYSIGSPGLIPIVGR